MSVTDRGIVKLWKAVEDLGSDIKNIANTGLTALTSNTERNTFIGMHHALDKLYDKFCDKWSNCTDYSDDKELEFPQSSHTEFVEEVKYAYYTAHGYYEQLRSHRQAATNVVAIARPTLPPITIKPFTGQISDWLHFKQVFTAIVLEDSSLSDIERFKYLLTYVEGQAHEKIKNIPVLAENFSQAWKCLDDLYSNERKLACHYLDRILNYKFPAGKPNFDQLQSYQSQVAEIINAFKCLSLPPDMNLGEYLLCELAIRVMDPSTREGFESCLANHDIKFPKPDDINTFIDRRCKVLSVQINQPLTQITSHKPKYSHNNRSINIAPPSPRTALMAASSAQAEGYHPTTFSSHPPCYICRKPHPLFKCIEFNSTSPQGRTQLLKDWVGCRNCLYTSHRTKDCPSKTSCRECNKRHHTLLHYPTTATFNTASKIPSAAAKSHQNSPASQTCIPSSSNNRLNSDTASPKSLNANCLLASAKYDVLLGTAIARIQDQHGSLHPVRLIVDCGSQSSFITEGFAASLGLSLQPAAINITGIGQTRSPSATAKVICKIQPAISPEPLLMTTALVVPKIAPPLPSKPVPDSMQEFFKSFELADPAFGSPRPIQLLIGADLYPDLITGAPISINADVPRLIPTIFGHLLMGPYCSEKTVTPSSVTSFLAATKPESSVRDDLGELMNKFWELEELPSSKPLTPAEQAADIHFKDTHYRLPCGRYVVGLAFKDGQPSLGPSKTRAQTRFYNLERTFNKYPDRKSSYAEFLREYKNLGHLSISSEEGAYYIPHHAVYKLDNSGNEKIRVVFDGSAKTALGSLNDHLLVGPKLQQDICTVLLNFRRHFVVFIADIVKMYRQILIRPEDRKFQHILWRDDPSLPLENLQLNTITYGLTSSPYLALKVLQQLAEDEGTEFPLAVHILLESCYVDDLNGGAPTVSQALTVQKQLIDLLKRGGFTLGKWASNRTELLDAVQASHADQPISLQDFSTQGIGILGLQWDPVKDILTYKVQPLNFNISRRSILSVIARLYDPLGLLAPVTFHAKMIMQDTWQHQELSWDDPVPSHIAHRWLKFLKDLPSVSLIQLPRFVSNTDHCKHLFVGFCDASSKGYCAAIYLVTYSDTLYTSHLLKSKTKLASVKPLITIPRLELCGALLLTRLYRSLSDFIIHFPDSQALFFTDSSNVLGWLSTPVNSLLTFTAHRISEILQFTSVDQWRHVRSEHNPADLGSRGLLPSQLLDNSLWWNGPGWLVLDKNNWPVSSVDLARSELPELKKNVIVTLAAPKERNYFLDWIDRFPGGTYQFPKLIRVIAYMLRFARHSKGNNELPTQWQEVLLPEYNRAHTSLLSIVQVEAYPEAFDQGTTSTPFLRALNVFIDDDGLLRVGGRLTHSALDFGSKYPILLPRRGRLAEIIVSYYHYRCLHAGSAAVLHAIQQTYWLPGGRNLVKQIQRTCPRCIRFNSQPRTPFMADLPANRINIAHPFFKVGTDFAGPFLCKSSHLRKAPVVKVYLCLFICLVTKAVHLEIAEGLSTEAFLDAFERFIARRGLPAEVLSDCGTNFKGASNYIQEIHEWHSDITTRHQILSYALPRHINWRFIPPHSPHFGGIWESQIKSAKTLLRKILGVHSCTAGELNTIFIRIEAIMNSRPLYAMSTDPQDLEALTPGHFLVGRSLTALPEPNFTDVPENHLRSWQWIRQRTQFFWERWTKEYLQTLQARQKWHTHRPNIGINDLVLLSEDGVPPLHWPMGRILSIYPGRDGIVRVVKIKTTNGEFTRPVAKIVRLVPFDNPDPAIHDP